MELTEERKMVHWGFVIIWHSFSAFITLDCASHVGVGGIGRYHEVGVGRIEILFNGDAVLNCFVSPDCLITDFHSSLVNC